MKLGLISAGSASLVLGLLAACGGGGSTGGDGPATPGGETPGGGEADGGPGTTPPNSSAAAQAAAKVVGTSGSVALTEVYLDPTGRFPADFAFNPDKPGQVWILNYGSSSTTILEGVGTGDVTGQHLKDPAASHFMGLPTQIAWGDKGFWATCGDQNGGNDFMGPALFTSNLDVYAKATPGGLGSHYDMLHSTPFCRGIAHVEGNQYFAFNSAAVNPDGTVTGASLDWYDFQADHDAGADDHSDGKIRRFASGQLKGGAKGVVSHLAYDKASKMLYAADTGNQRVVKLDTTTGTPGANLPRNEVLVERKFMDDTNVVEVVAPGVLLEPSGLHLHEGVLYVGDRAENTLYAFEAATGAELAKIPLELSAEAALTGLHVGPDGKLYLLDQKAARFLRVDPQ